MSETNEILERATNAAKACFEELCHLELRYVAEPDGYTNEGWFNVDGSPDFDFQVTCGMTGVGVIAIWSSLAQWREDILAAQVAGLLLPLANSPKEITGRHFATMHDALLDLASDAVATLGPVDPEFGVPTDFDHQAFLPIAIRIQRAIDDGIEMWRERETEAALGRAKREVSNTVPSHVVEVQRPQVSERCCPVRIDGQDVSVQTRNGDWTRLPLGGVVVEVLRALSANYPNGCTRDDLQKATNISDPVRPLNDAHTKYSALRCVLQRPETAKRGQDSLRPNRIQRKGIYRLVSPL